MIVLAMSACGGTDERGSRMPDDGLGPGARVTYHFQDSSVPPPYHRSYRLTFDRADARIVVDSYGEVLADRTASMPEQVWKRLSETFDSVRGLTAEEPEQGCTGGTGFALSVVDDGTQTLAVEGLACGGANSQTAEALSDWVAPVRALFPSMDQLAPEGA